MKHIVLFTAIALISGLFTANQGQAGGEYEHGKLTKGTSSMMEETQQPQMAARSLDMEQVREVQNILKDNGFDAGAADGIIGPRTEQALRDFQKSEGLAVTGKPTAETLQALAPDAETQEFLGVAPEFGEKEMMEMEPMGEKMMGTEPMEEKMMGTEPMEEKMTPEGSKMKESY